MTAEEFAHENPHVEVELVRMGRLLKSRGIRRVGMMMLINAIRWLGMATSGKDYKMNNNHAAYYSRSIMRKYYDLNGFFTTRTCKYDK